MEPNKDSKSETGKLAATTAVLGGASILGAIGLGAVAGWTRNAYVKVAALVGAAALGLFGFAEATATAIIATSDDAPHKKGCGCTEKAPDAQLVENSTGWRDKQTESQGKSSAINRI